MSTKICNRNNCNSCSPKGLKNPISPKTMIQKRKKLVSINTNPILNTKDLTTKLEIIEKIYEAKTLLQKQELLNRWPNIEITQRNHLPLLELKPDIYFKGDANDNLIHGYGLVIYNTQRFYEGYFQNNLKYGPGFEKLEFGVYVGNFINNKPEGKGLFIWNNNDMYEGDFALGIKHGFGKYVSKKLTYVGQWKQNIPYGNGTIITKQSKYEGSIMHGTKHGLGMESFNNGDTYTGTFVNGKFEGLGTYFWFESGAVYKGLFKNGLRHGEGEWTNSIGDKFEGMYENNRKNGMGTLRYSNGNMYTGDFSNDLKHGYGSMMWNNGQKYQGRWKFGEIDNQLKLSKKISTPQNKNILKRSKTETYDDISNVSTKVKIGEFKNKNKLLRLRTEMTEELTSELKLRDHSRKFLSRLEPLTCPHQRAPKILFKQSKKKMSQSQNARLIHDPNHNCTSRKTCSVVNNPQSLDKKSNKSTEVIKINRLDIKSAKRIYNEECY